MEVNTFFTEDECGSDSHNKGRGRGRGRIGRRSQGSALSGGSNPGGASFGGHSTGRGRNTTSGRGWLRWYASSNRGIFRAPKKEAWSSFRSW
jgi:hypothetical protein